ncbi:hypothetical protein HPB51_029055 [Rhipicephalus microplus]|uniref:MULE transposase domain-containing protein n=1 Tax=Rhipicephalus microplus TaxID=6941 RepID=A0A9J6CVC2_RHIMP|nr:hypothetical protein HPB51_029055 [Rhipicephalus microplus]
MLLVLQSVHTTFILCKNTSSFIICRFHLQCVLVFYSTQLSASPTRTPALTGLLHSPVKLNHKKSCWKNWARGLCVSTQHMEGTIGYQFELSTLLVLDEVGSGIPIAYFICNKMNEEYLAAFFRSLEFAISKKVEAKRLMPDDASQFYKAWPPVMGAPQQKLLCAWHVDRNWQKKIHECLEKQLRPDVYHNLRLLLEFLDQQEFEEYLLSFLDIQETKLRDFLKYFKDSYAVIPQEWAYCFRTRAGINTNMRLESIHRTLKHSMSEGRKNKRVDKLISALMNLT